MRVDRRKQFYPIFVSEDDHLRVPDMDWNEQSAEYRILEHPREDEVVIWPIVNDQDGKKIEKRWERGRERVSREAAEYRVQRNDGASAAQKISIHFVQRMGVASVPKTWWGDSKYASSNHGAKVLKDLFALNPFDYPKSVALVEDCIRTAGGGEEMAQILDPFSGSGTTGHAVVNLNRDDGGHRNYVLVEIGHHFDTLMVPRMKKIIHSRDWSEGKPVSRIGVSQLFKCIRLESYEDAMDSLELKVPAEDLFAKNAELAEDYRLRYALGTETAGSACLLGKNFSDPFAYTLSVVRDGVRQEVPVDLPETFNYLLGLRIESRRRIDGVLTTTGTDAERRQCLILWHNPDETNNQALEAWFARNRSEFHDSLDIIYVNGDQTLNAIRQPGETWRADSIEPVFHELMFNEEE